MNAELTGEACSAEAGQSSKDSLRSLVDWELLRRGGYDPEAQVFAPDAGDPVFGFSECKALSCDQVARTTLGLCGRCHELWKKSGPGGDFALFCETAPGPLRHRRTSVLCAVCRTAGHERPVQGHGLCAACWTAMAKRGQSPEEYVHGDEEFPPAKPRPSFGTCEVATCTRFAWRAGPALCQQHYCRWRSEGRPSGRAMQAWRAKQGSIDRDSRVVVLSGLGEGARLEVLYSLQRAAELGRRARPTAVQGAVNILRAHRVTSVLGLAMAKMRTGSPSMRFLGFAVDQVTLALATRDNEAAKDDWDLRVFGQLRGFLRFSAISQSWLKETAKSWAAERIETAHSPNATQEVLRVLRVLSESLRRHRPDRGDDPRDLSRTDIAVFANDLAHIEARGDIAHNTRRGWLTDLDRFLREARAMGLSRPGGPMHGLAETVLHLGELPDVTQEEHGKALPQVVMDQLLGPAALGALEEAFGADQRAMVELEAQAGRRTGELCALRLECLAFEEVPDEAGELRSAPVLVHDMPKVGIVGYHLPIDEETAETVRAQQARVLARYPGADRSGLALFPSPVMNPRGTKGLSVSTFDAHFRSWVDSLPKLRGEDGEPYDRSSINVYSFRHSFAQRHADAGVPVEVLAELMGHSRLTSTRVYYRNPRELQQMQEKYLVGWSGLRRSDKGSTLAHRP